MANSALLVMDVQRDVVAIADLLRFGDGWCGTAPTPQRSPVSGAACVTSPALRTLIARLSLRPRSLLHPVSLRRSHRRDGRSAAPRPPAASVVDDLGQLAETGLTVYALWCLSRRSMSERPWSGAQLRWHRD
ncbi:hypothetical protein GCM10010345_91400 [Streptomyces canarius]|uniref:Isochorismatase-like domain-containing protein n=1 Tax=Streptomyces canarius TaxID=285453 RepID=A0ABQ3DBM4_9ACTN|nr:hypothetical protein GCM10010345_91400 [Streptomyces canarius]